MRTKLRLVKKMNKMEERLARGESQVKIYRAGNISLALCWDTMESVVVVKAATAAGRIETLEVRENYGEDVDGVIEKLCQNRYFGKSLVAPFLELYI